MKYIIVTIKHEVINMLQEIALQEYNSKFYKKIFDDFPALIWLAGIDSKCWYFNKKWLEFRGKSLEDEYGEGWVKGVHKEDLEFCVQYYLKNFEKRQQFQMEYRLQRADGEYRWILDMGIPFYNIEGEFMGYIGSCYDITDEKDRVKELEKSRREAMEMFQQRTKLLSYVSHELKNPLNSIIGLVALLKEKEYDEETNEIIGYLMSASKMLKGLINNILDFSRFESGNPELLEKSTDIHKLINEIRQVYEKIIVGKNLKFNVICKNPIESNIMCDEVRVTQIISNLLSNSVKFTNEGEITLSYDYLNGKLIIKVSDTGIGIDKEKIDKIFKEYVRVTTNIEGTGLGLAIVKGLVELMNGEIKVESELKKGSIFTIIIPVLLD